MWVTADGRIVINHDKTFPGDSHVIENSTYDQLKNIKLSNGENIPTLEDYLTQAAKSDKTTPRRPTTSVRPTPSSQRSRRRG